MTTELFARIPLWLSLDGGVRALPAPARVALYDVAAAGGTIRCGAAPHSALEALCAGAGEHLDLLLDRGLVEIDGGRLSLVSPDGALWEARSAVPLNDGQLVEITGIDGLALLVKPSVRSEKA